MLKISVLTESKDSFENFTERLRKLDSIKSISHFPDLADLIISGEKPERPHLVIINIEYKLVYIPKLFALFSKSFEVVFCGSINSGLHQCCLVNDIPFFAHPLEVNLFDNYLKNIALRKFQNIDKDSISSDSDQFFVKCDKGKLKRVIISKILYIEAKQNYVSIYQDTFNIVFSFTLTGMIHVLPQSSFIRVHRSFIINIDRIQAVEANNILLDNDVVIPIGHSYKNSVLNILLSKTLDISK